MNTKVSKELMLYSMYHLKWKFSELFAQDELIKLEQFQVKTRNTKTSTNTNQVTEILLLCCLWCCKKCNKKGKSTLGCLWVEDYRTACCLRISRFCWETWVLYSDGQWSRINPPFYCWSTWDMHWNSQDLKKNTIQKGARSNLEVCKIN